MSLSREQLLAEMGISPVWRLREPAGGAAEAPEVPPVAGEDTPREPVATAHVAPEAAQFEPPPHLHLNDAPTPEREARIAALDWPGLKTDSDACRACVLCEHRQQAVLGVGDVEADWLFVGEGPGAEEDARGEPFVGQAGKLLDAMLAAIDLKRGEDVYIANAVKCRPPGNRTPAPEEMAACKPYLARQIELMKPRLIVLLGKAAVASVLGKDVSLASLRGKRFDYHGVPVVVTYHPAYLLRNLPEKAKAWEDLVFARRLMRELKAAG